ncbi:MAG: DUF4974 domain-containing protein [Prevotella sp.]|nr:DUF4974 domain-containing protein [Prevotella sp.]
MESNDNNRLEDLLRKMYAEEDIDTSEIIDEEWQKFEAKHFPQKQRSWGWMQIAAMFIGVLMLSGIAYATVQVISNIESKPKVAITDRKPDVKKVKKTYGVEVAPTKKAPVIYNNVELGQIMQYIADGYGVKVEFRNEAARTLRFYLQWEADDTLQEIIDKINHFEKVHLTLTDETITID